MSATTPTPSTTLPQPQPAEDATSAPPVVVGADGSECGLRAVRWAAEEAARRGAPLRIVHAGAIAPDVPRDRGATAQAYTVARHTEPSVATSTEVVTDAPVTALLRAAEDAQLLVLGISTTGAADEMVLASVAQKVAARSPRPVVVVPRQRASTLGSRPHVAVLGLGDPGDDEPVARFAAEEALRTGRPLTVLHTRPGDDADWTADAAAWAERFPDLRVSHQPLPHVTGGRVLTAACPTPLLTMSAGHGGLLHRSMDGLHRWLLRHCTSPMALVPSGHRRSATDAREEAGAEG
ncbi:universal stress protein [Geodermatophilus sabuli]|uniref:Nucleotide-binding universal stress protein, UspA family n=1 Tax=Geodermatophilus sabuli TaxID=1564158 RepID=A0A285ED36_9ACTN|nr:universal stress protein [Geodermatophilus sabuli]MBB3083382.1 nucleotide-binding universal stress UspA family protein [Geodermatophilus sabuli]SNX96897.1 Nucleotide-binding universal stress protein, UspA family [Geodermatophilus sabuli]